jgi:DNA helicase-2/ATP-dependent DNA helicase PcrA
VHRITAGEFPARPSPTKCAGCDFAKLCPQRVEQFTSDGTPPPLHLPGGRLQMIAAFADVEAH